MEKPPERTIIHKKGRNLKRFAVILLAIAVLSHIFWGFKSWLWALYIIGGMMMIIWFIFYMKGSEIEHNIGLTGKFRKKK